jgi:hypothetical protein
MSSSNGSSICRLQRIGLSLGLGKPHDLESALRFFEKRSKEKTTEEYTQTMLGGVTRGVLAAWLKATYPDVLCTVSGHTHRPLIHAVAGGTGDDPNRERVYFNSGTWLDVLEEGPAGACTAWPDRACDLLQRTRGSQVRWAQPMGVLAGQSARKQLIRLTREHAMPLPRNGRPAGQPAVGMVKR